MGTARRHTAERRFRLALGLILLVGLALRVAYLLAQPASDPAFRQPGFDGEYYFAWAHGLLSGQSPEGAYYLAPLYPFFLAPLLAVFGDNFHVLFLVQHLLSIATAALIGLRGRRLVGDGAALAGAGLFLLHHPLTFFASTPMGETLALFLLFAALGAVIGESTGAAARAGLLMGLAALGGLNLLLVPVAWALFSIYRHHWKRAGVLLGAVALVLLPVTLRNLVRSGHPVPISSNGGITAYHGNGPGAEGVFTLPVGFSGILMAQREEATALARHLSGVKMDAVEADAWWGRAALRTRLADIPNTAALLVWRVMLTLDNREHGLDYPPVLDRNPFRPTLRLGSRIEIPLVSFALLLGLAAAGLAARGPAGTGGAYLWLALIACAATPVLFYVSSRYRLPTSALLAVPAGSGLAVLANGAAGIVPRPRRLVAAGVALTCAALSWAVPSAAIARKNEAEGRSNLALSLRDRGDLAAAEAEARRAVEMGPGSARVHLNLGIVLAAQGDVGGAERAYRNAIQLDPGQAGAATNLSSILLRRGAATEAIIVLRRALRYRPNHPECWHNLILALVGTGDREGGRRAMQEAQRRGVELQSSVLELIEGPGGVP